jgi:DNA-binding response OmpR family regulator
MTARRVYDTAEALIYDPVAPNRNGTRTSLHSLGIRRVGVATALDALEDRLRMQAPDLLVVEVTGAESEVCALIQKVRQGTLGDNPFIVIVATTWRRDGTIIGQVVNSGADDLIARPVSTTVLGERIKALVERRKPFVITSDYIGPDRRREVRSPGAEQIEVPNPLKVRTLEWLSVEDADRQIAEEVRLGKEMLNHQKMRRDAVQLCLRWRMLEQRTPGARDFCEMLPRIAGIASEIDRRAGIANHQAARESCDSILKSAAALIAMGEGADGAGSGMDYRPLLSLLGRATLTLGKTLAPEEVEPARLMELDRLIASRKASTAAA